MIIVLTQGAEGKILDTNATPMKKKTPDNDELRPHYDFDYGKMKPNRFAGKKKVYKQTSVKTSRGSASHPKR